VMVSLRASSVRQAQQTLSVAFLVLFVPLLLLPLLPNELQATVQTAFKDIDLSSVVTSAGLFLLIVDLVLISIAFRRFKRSQLILSGD
jgi:protein-S-isoprenylcysteine O-methyltransferase Ste14